MKKKILFILIVTGIIVLVSLFALIAIMFGSSGTFGPDGAAIPYPSGNELEAFIENEMSNLREGKILYSVPKEMTVGETERIQVRIAKSISDDFTESLESSEAPEIEDIKVDSLMKVELKYENDKFDILNLSTTEQVVSNDTYTQWSWDVTPLKSGEQKLRFLASFRVFIPDEGVDQYQDINLSNKLITVKVNPWYSISKFVTTYWQWLIGTILLPAAGLVYKRLKNQGIKCFSVK